MIFPRAPRTISAIAVISMALLFSGCGQRSGLIPKNDAESLLTQLDAVERLLTSGACDQLASAIGDAQAQVTALPNSVDPALRNRIEEGLANLTTQAPRDCLQGTQTTTTPTTTTSTTSTTATATVPTTPTQTTPTPTPTATTPPTPTATTPAPTPTTTTPSNPPDSGGAPSDGGGTGGVSPDTGGATP